MRKVYQKKYLEFPPSAALSGKCFQGEPGCYEWTNFASKNKAFVEEIDNQSTVSNIKNFLIGQALGHDGKPNAVIQLMNRVDEVGSIQDITEADIHKYEQMRRLIGMCVDNTTMVANSI